MTLNDYQKTARLTANYKEKLIYPTIGLNGEAGEVAEKVKKWMRDDKRILTDKRKLAIALELGDVLWYVASLASDLGITLQAVAELNNQKLKNRVKNNTINGDGDYRELSIK